VSPALFFRAVVPLPIPGFPPGVDRRRSRRPNPRSGWSQAALHRVPGADLVGVNRSDFPVATSSSRQFLELLYQGVSYIPDR